MGLAPPPDQDVVVFGATGDLSARKLLPALFNLASEGLLPRRGDIVGVAPVEMDQAGFVAFARDAVGQFSRTKPTPRALAAFLKRLRFVRLDPNAGLRDLRAALRHERRLVYLAVPPAAFGSLITELGETGLAEGTSLIIEKPFGHDVDSARQLNETIHAVLPEQRVFRIDHYLGKETVQNLLVFRFGNSVFERIWNRDAVARVEITVAESLGVEKRGAFYEQTGAIRDIVQNHLFQVLAITAMEPPVSFDADSIRNEKVKVLRALRPLNPAEVVRGQYRAGSIDGERVPGYHSEPGVDRHSTTETFAAMRLCIDSWRWSGVPFLVRTGKRMARRDTHIVITFHEVPLHLFAGTDVGAVDSNRLIVHIQPNEGIAISFVAKVPGPEVRIQPVNMSFNYGTSFKTSPPEAYERLLHDALEGDHTLFIREDEVERGWEVVQPVLDAPPPLVTYRAGSWGPRAADPLAAPLHWHNAGAGDAV
ncbi:MAG TPA: glucose-6-phosphate dehydrogenase [Candidatus Dormibacteraeota bacterium]|nr:glucose-6-phosphate dehydrogenase [Candidatus Dormibacteraeota bacterium]